MWKNDGELYTLTEDGYAGSVFVYTGPERCPGRPLQMIGKPLTPIMMKHPYRILIVLMAAFTAVGAVCA